MSGKPDMLPPPVDRYCLMKPFGKAVLVEAVESATARFEWLRGDLLAALAASDAAAAQARRAVERARAAHQRTGDLVTAARILRAERVRLH